MHLPFSLRDSYRRVLLFRPAAIAYLDDVWPDHHSRTYTHTHTHQMVKEEEERRRMLLEPRWPLASIIPFDYFDSRPFFFEPSREKIFFFFFFLADRRFDRTGFYFYFISLKKSRRRHWNQMKFEKGRERRGQQQRTMKSITVKNVRSFARHNTDTDWLLLLRLLTRRT